MTKPSPKEQALRAIEGLPDDASIEDAMEGLYVIAKVERGLADIAAGRVMPHEEVRARFGLR